MKNSPHQSFDCQLDSKAYTITLMWNATARFWTLTISERDGEVIARSKVVVNTPLFAALNDERLPQRGTLAFVSSTSVEMGAEAELDLWWVAHD